MSVDRNGPCPCGSGIKWKKCCRLKEMQAAEDERIPGAKGCEGLVDAYGNGQLIRCWNMTKASDPYQRRNARPPYSLTLCELCLAKRPAVSGETSLPSPPAVGT